MIILDTCILRGCGLDSSGAELLRTIRESGTEGVAVPWIVMEELVAQHAVKYRKQHEAAVQAVKALKKLTPWELDARLEDGNPAMVREHWRDRYGVVVDTVPTSERALREAAVREANGLAPARIDTGASRSVKTGYRDAAVWMSVMDYALDHPEETVYFVSSNTKDFGDGVTYESPMGWDVDGLENEFVHLTSLDQVLDRFTEPAEVSEEYLRKLLTVGDASPTIGMQVYSRDGSQAFEGGFDATAFRGSLGSGPYRIWADKWLAAPAAVMDSMSDAQAFKIGEHVWCTVNVRWLLSGLAFPDRDNRDLLAFASCWWDTRLLLSVQDEPRLVVLRGQSPKRLTDEDLQAFAGKAPDVEAVIRSVIEAGQLPAMLRRIEVPAPRPSQGGSDSRVEDALAELTRIFQREGGQMPGVS
ncbi:MAG TPA: PIN domain-containing protein [Streptomyces sp.]